MLTAIEIARQMNIACRKGVKAEQISTFKGGGEIETLIEPQSTDDFVRIVDELYKQGYKPFILGGGSNVIVADGTIHTPVLSTAGLRALRVCSGKICAEAGVKLSDAIALGRENGLGGLEFLCGVPCSVGGALKMNAGAFGCQMADYIDEITLLTLDSDDNCWKESVITHRNIDFGYRTGARGIVLAARLRMLPMSREESLASGNVRLKQRIYKQPQFPSCGSVFKNGAYPSALLIDKCGLKGRRAGGAEISEKHANFIVNKSNATAFDFLELVELCERAVQDRFGIALQREFVLLE